MKHLLLAVVWVVMAVVQLVWLTLAVITFVPIMMIMVFSEYRVLFFPTITAAVISAAVLDIDVESEIDKGDWYE